MRRGVRRGVVVLVTIAATALALLPTGRRDPAGAAEPLRLTVGTLGSIGSLDPRRGDSDIAREVWKLQYPTLTSLDPKTLETAPGLAGSWSPTPSGKGWIYKLRRGLTWSDGQPVTADDVVYSIRDGAADAWPYANVVGASFLGGLTARALDSQSVQVTPNDIDRRLPGLLVHVVPEHVFTKVADLDTDLEALGVSDGTWHVTARTRDSVQLDANAVPSGPALQQIVFRTYPDARALIDALDKKQVDVASGLPDSDVDRLSARSDVTVVHASDGSQLILRFRLRDEKIRQAVSLAIDRTALVADAVHGVGTPGVVPVIAYGKTWALEDSAVQSLTASLDAQPGRARQLLAKVPAAARKITMGVSFGHPQTREVATLVRRALAPIGIEVTIADTDDSEGTYSTADMLVLPNVVTDNPYYPYDALDRISCDCARAQHVPSTDYTELVDLTHARLQRLTGEARVVGLFEPDTLQAFHTDNVTGFLRDPEIRRLVAFGPTVAQYSQLTAAPPPPGEQMSNTAYAVGAVVLLAMCLAAFAFAAWIRRRVVRNEGAP